MHMEGRMHRNNFSVILKSAKYMTNMKKSPPGTSSFGEGEGPNVFRFNPRNADDIFVEIFNNSNTFGRMGGFGGMGSRSTTFQDDMFGGFGGHESMFGNFGDRTFGSKASTGPRKVKPVGNKLPCMLEDMYKGTTKKMKISRNIADISGKTMSIEEIVKPSYKKMVPNENMPLCKEPNKKGNLKIKFEINIPSGLMVE